MNESDGGTSTIGDEGVFRQSRSPTENYVSITEVWIYAEREKSVTYDRNLTIHLKENASIQDVKQSFIIQSREDLESLDSIPPSHGPNYTMNSSVMWPCPYERMTNQSDTNCFFYNKTEEESKFGFSDKAPSSLQLRVNFDAAKPRSKQRSKGRKPPKSELDLMVKPPVPQQTLEAISTDFVTSLAEDNVSWVVGEKAPLQASADNASAIGYKSATLLSEEVATVSAAVASVLIFWSVLGTAVCLVLRFRRRKRRHLKRHSLEDIAHIDMLDEMIRTELARGRARLNTSSTASQSSPTYVNVPPPFVDFQTAFDSVQVMNSYNSISHNRNRQNVYEHFVTGIGSQRIASERNPATSRSVYNSPNIERVACVRLSNARSFEVLQKTVRSRKIDFHRSRSFTEKSAKALVYSSQEKTTPELGRCKYNKKSMVKKVGYISLREKSDLSCRRQEMSLDFPQQMKTSFDKTRTPEHPTESTVLNGRGQYYPYHASHPTTSSVMYSATRLYQEHSQAPSRHMWLNECQGGPGGDIRRHGYPLQSIHVGLGRPANFGCSGRPVRFPKMGQSCLMGEFQRNVNMPSTSKITAREKFEMLHCI